MDLNDIPAFAYYRRHLAYLAPLLFLKGRKLLECLEILKINLSHYNDLLEQCNDLPPLQSSSFTLEGEAYSFNIPSEYYHEGIPTAILATCAITGQIDIFTEFKRFKDKPKSAMCLVHRNAISPEWWWWKQNRTYVNYQYEYEYYDAYKRSPRFWKNPAIDEMKFGFEFELEFRTLNDKLRFAKAIYKHHKPCICEKDGSLDDGLMDGPSLELITPPMGYEEGLEKVNAILSLARQHFVKPPRNGYGWHITINTTGLSMANRIIYLINHEALHPFWLHLARRDTSKAPKDYAKFIHYPCINDVFGINHVVRWQSKPVDHFYAAFMRQNGAIELRFIKSSVDFSQIESTMKIIKRLYMFCRYASNRVFDERHLSFPNIYKS